MKQIILIIYVFFLLNIPILAQITLWYQLVDQPDTDRRIIKGPEGTHIWQPYMQNADLSNYHHAPAAAEQFKDLKFGTRIHWGIYSIVDGRESCVIKQHDSFPLASQGFYHYFNKGWFPYAFNDDKWTDIMVDDGFKFFTFTSKHHDGFSMYDTKTTVKNKFIFFGKDAGSIEPCYLRYSIMETPFGRDVTAELVKSAKERGLKIGLDFSHPDWFDTDFRFNEWNPNLDTTYTPEKYPEVWERFKTSHKDNTITYTLIEGWPGGSLFVDHVRLKRRSDIYLLGYDQPLPWEKSGNGIVIKLPEEMQNKENRPCKQAFAFKIIGEQQ